MKKEFVPYELAVKLKKLGFDEPCLLSWNLYTHEVNFNGQPSKFTSEDVIQLPTFSQAFRWFRDKYNYSHEISKTYGGDYIPYANGSELNTNNEQFQWIYKTYEEAELACLDKLIEIVESKSE